MKVSADAVIFYPSAVTHLCPSFQIIKDLAWNFTPPLNTMSLHFLFFLPLWFLFSVFPTLYPPHFLTFFLLRSQSPSPKTIITSLVMQLADRLILQKELNPTAQHQQIILSAKPAFPFWNNALIYTRVTLKLMQENLKEVKHGKKDIWTYCCHRISVKTRPTFCSWLAFSSMLSTDKRRTPNF